jgi:psiF repeat
MLRTLGLVSLLLAPSLMLATPAAAVTAKQKMETCKFGADDQKLTGAKRNAFIKKCMGKGNYEPPERKKLTAHKPKAKKPMAKKPAAKPMATTPPASEPPPPKQ